MLQEKKKWPRAKISAWVSKNATLSDEAYALFLLENNWDYWLEQYAIKERNGDLKEGVKTPLYTRGKEHSTKKFAGVSQEGVIRFNDLFRAVKEDRNGHEANMFEDRFMCAMKEEHMRKRAEMDKENGSNKASSNGSEDNTWKKASLQVFADELEDEEEENVIVNPTGDFNPMEMMKQQDITAVEEEQDGSDLEELEEVESGDDNGSYSGNNRNIIDIPIPNEDESDDDESEDDSSDGGSSSEDDEDDSNDEDNVEKNAERIAKKVRKKAINEAKRKKMVASM